jgi:hypothetical protein
MNAVVQPFPRCQVRALENHSFSIQVVRNPYGTKLRNGSGDAVVGIVNPDIRKTSGTVPRSASNTSTGAPLTASLLTPETMKQNNMRRIMNVPFPSR